MKYVCEKCNYATDNISNYKRHEKSQTHIQLVQNTSTICADCNQTLSSISCLSRHQKYYCKIIKEKENEKDIKIMKLESKLKQIESDIKIDMLTKQVENYKEIITSGKCGVTNYNISIKKYIQQNYADAPILKKIKNYDELFADDDDFISTLVYNYNKNILHKYLGDFVIGYYKKDDPMEQSIWNSDVARLTYIVKELLANKESMWNQDCKGAKTKNCIINPLLKYVKEVIDEYWAENIKNIKNPKKMDTEHLVQVQNKLVALKKIKGEIDNGLLAENIVRYIAPEFYMNTTQHKALKNACFIDQDDDECDEDDDDDEN